MAQGIILAAGYASRAASNKMLFELDGKTILEHAIDGMRPFVSHIFVVTGHYEPSISAKLKGLPNITTVHNASYHLGMFSSVQKGVFMVSESFFILPGDCPFVSKKTYLRLLSGSKPIRVPSHQHQRGHPLWIDIDFKDALLAEHSTSNLKVFRNKHDFETIEMNDPNILLDIDTCEDFIKINENRKE
ncbi:MAG: nucleotidyltransferase family protein [Acholeplasmataceae bacterium]|nr:nucleotidyltransferase family protein [Acholeplasmataceae bacterium]